MMSGGEESGHEGVGKSVLETGSEEGREGRKEATTKIYI
jgi:hypothetical protein